MEFSRQEYQSGWPFPSPRDVSDPGIKPSLLHCSKILYCLSQQGSLIYVGSLSKPVRLTLLLVQSKMFPLLKHTYNYKDQIKHKPFLFWILPEESLLKEAKHILEKENQHASSRMRELRSEINVF